MVIVDREHSARVGRVTLRAAFFDVGDTLVEHWPPREVGQSITRAKICAELGELPWLDDFLATEFQPRSQMTLAEALAAHNVEDGRFAPSDIRQETHQWFSEWLADRGIDLGAVDIDRLRTLMCVPFVDVTTPVPGAFDAIRWCADRGVRVTLVTNTLSHGETDVLEDFRRFGLADAIHGVASSHSVGWRKPHPAIFEHALQLAQAEPSEVVHVGDNLIADVFGAQQLGIRAVWRRLPRAGVDPAPGHGPAPAAIGRKSARACGHPSEGLLLNDGAVRCAGCGELVPVDVRPEAVIDDLTELPSLLAPWLTERTA